MKICVLPGDGIGVEVVAEATRVLEVLRSDGNKFELETALIGGAAYDATGNPLPDSTLKLAKEADAVFLGAVGAPKYDTLPWECNPERALLGIRKSLDLFANLRPVALYPELLNASSFKAEVVSEVELTHLLVDNAAMQLARNPKQFDVIVTGNMFGDILSDQASMIAGSIGMLPSAALDSKNKGMYEPIHGSAPDIAGKDIANPLATILSVAMMLRHTFKLTEVAERVENAVKKALVQGYRTGDIYEPGMKRVGTRGMGDAVISALG